MLNNQQPIIQPQSQPVLNQQYTQQLMQMISQQNQDVQNISNRCQLLQQQFQQSLHQNEQLQQQNIHLQQQNQQLQLQLQQTPTAQQQQASFYGSSQQQPATANHQQQQLQPINNTTPPVQHESAQMFQMLTAIAQRVNDLSASMHQSTPSFIFPAYNSTGNAALMPQHQQNISSFSQASTQPTTIVINNPSLPCLRSMVSQMFMSFSRRWIR